MRTLLFVLFLVSSICALGQPIVLHSDFTQAGTVLHYKNASPAWLLEMDVNIGVGQDFVWNYSDFQHVDEQDVGYVSVTSVPFMYQVYFNNDFMYPDNLASHAQYFDIEMPGFELPIAISDPYIFYRNDDSGYYIVGTAYTMEGLPLSSPYERIDRVYQFPLEYGNADTSSSFFLTQIPFIAAFGQDAIRYNEVDGWGTLITPDTAYSVLRVKSERLITDTIYIEQMEMGQTIQRPLQVDISWISPGVQGPIMEVSIIEGLVVSARMYGAPSSVGTADVRNEGLKVYPNPSGKTIRLEGADIGGELRILTLSGALLEKHSIAGMHAEMDISHLPEGMYILELSTSSTRFIERLVVVR